MFHFEDRGTVPDRALDKNASLLKKIGGAMLIFTLFTSAVLKVQASEHKEKTKDLAVRLGKLRQKASHPQFRFRIAVTLAIAHYADQMMEQHYWEFACKHEKSNRQKVKPADDEDRIPREHKDRAATWRIQHRVHKVIAEIWEALKERGREASPLDVATKFYQ